VLFACSESEGLFLIREGGKAGADYAISAVFESKVWHYRIQRMPSQRYHFYGGEFETLVDLVAHHMLHPGKMLGVLRDSPLR
jgi:hypothetical protein